MGHRATISGHIQEAWYTVREKDDKDCGHQRIRDLNDAAIADLSRRQGPAFFRPDMFAVTLADGSSAYRGRVFHFGLSIHSFWEAGGDADEWLGSFEGLLRSMYWEHAQMLVTTEIMGSFHYLWKVSHESEMRYLEDPPLPARDWDFRCDDVKSLISRRSET